MIFCIYVFSNPRLICYYKNVIIFRSAVPAKNGLNAIFESKLDNFNFQSEIGFVKIDVEGHEQSVLEGSINTLKKYKPNLLIEIDRRYNVDVNKTFKFLNDLGYNFYFYNKKKLVKIKSYEENYQKDFRNFIFLSK